MKKKQSSLGVILTGGLKEEGTPRAGVALLAELYRKAGIEAAAERALPKKRSPKGLTQGQMVESFVLLNALGGDCIEDMERLRQDRGLAAMLGYHPPAPETARQWLDKFHDEELMNEQPLQGSFMASESGALAGLKEPNRHVIETYVERVKAGCQVTLDVDAHLVETAKANAHYCYEGYRAFRPMEVEWAETALVLADEFREGNVYTGRGIKEIVDEAYNMLPPAPWHVKVRSDSAAYQRDVLDHWHERGWQFAVSADMSRGLKKEIEALPEDSCKVWKMEKRRMIREWAEVPYVPAHQYERKDSQPYR